MFEADIRIIFQDIDGCLNPESGEPFGVEADSELSPDQAKMLREISRALDDSPIEYMVINTGRFWPIVQFLADEIPSKKLRYFVMEHGAVVYDRLHDQWLDLYMIAKDLGLKDLLVRFENLKIVERILQWYDREGRPYLEAFYGTEMPRLDKIANLSFAVPLSCQGEEILERVKSLMALHLPAETLEVLDFCRSDRFIDILPGIHKLDGIDLMCAYLGVDHSQAVAMGDYLNDLAVFEGFERVICPSNAHSRIVELTRMKGEEGIVSEHAYGRALVGYLEATTTVGQAPEV